MVERAGEVKKEQEQSMGESKKKRTEKVDHSHEERAHQVKEKRNRVYDPHRKRACVDCINRCVRIHGKASSDEKAPPVATLPSFFKIMMGYFSENMDIPPPFAKKILNLAGTNVYLEDAFGLRWRVQLCLHDGFLSFGHGWENFVVDHAIKVGEFLVFRQIARSVFSVEIFAPSACERMFLCERNQRQSKKRKSRKKTSSPSHQTVKKSMKNKGKISKKKQRTYPQNDQDPSECHKLPQPSVICYDSEILRAASELRCSETSKQAPSVGTVEAHEVYVLDGDTETESDSKFYEDDETECIAITGEHHIHGTSGSMALESMVAMEASSNTKDMTVDANTETDKCRGSSFPASAELRVPLAMMDLNEEITDDIILSSDMYEFDSDFCNPETLSFELNMEGVTTNGQTSGFSCLEIGSRSCDSSTQVGHWFRMPETSSCQENKEMTDVPTTCTDSPVNDIDINALPSYELSKFPYISSPETGGEMPSSECAIESCKKDKHNVSIPLEKTHIFTKTRLLRNQVEPKAENSSAKQHSLLDGRPDTKQNPMHPGNNHEGLQSGSLKANKRKFCISMPPPDQTWLELPCRLPVLPRKKKQGRKIVVLKDPCARLWPVLYHCTPGFDGFISGWADISKENNMQEGDTCEFELSGNSELSFQVRMANFQ